MLLQCAVKKFQSSRKRSAPSDSSEEFSSPAQRRRLESAEQTASASSSEENHLDDQRLSRTAKHVSFIQMYMQFSFLAFSAN
jgi:hypothetical protein